jgi:hypothetical protein
MTEGKFQPGNQSADTPDLSETELRGLQMPQLREIAGQAGVPGADGLRRDDLIKAISNVYRERRHQAQGGGQRQAAGAQQGGGQRQAAGAQQGNPPGNQTPDTPDLSETELRGLQMAELRDRARQEGVPNADELRKGELIDAISARHRHPQR